MENGQEAIPLLTEQLSERTREQVEIACLRAFYRAWVEFQKIPNDGLHRQKQQLAAQGIVDARRSLIKFDQLYGANDG